MMWSFQGRLWSAGRHVRLHAQEGGAVQPKTQAHERFPAEEVRIILALSLTSPSRCVVRVTASCCCTKAIVNGDPQLFASCNIQRCQNAGVEYIYT